MMRFFSPVAVGLALCFAVGLTYAQDAAAPVSLDPTPKRDPAVETILDSNPQSAGDLVRVAAILADMGRADLAKKYLEQLAAANPDEDALADAALRVPPDLLLRLGANKELQPEAAKWVDAVMKAAAERSRDPQRLQGEIDKLVDPSRSVQREAMARILAAQDDAVPALVLALADKNRAAVHPMARAALMQLGEQAVAPLVAALEADDPGLQVQVIDSLRKIGSPEAVVYLAVPAASEARPVEVRDAARTALFEIQRVTTVTPDEAIQLLTREIKRLLSKQRPLRVNADGQVAVWKWDAAGGVPVRTLLALDHAYAAKAARLANDLVEIAPEDSAARRLWLLATLEDAAYGAGLDSSLPPEAIDRAAKFGSPALESVLAEAMTSGHVPAATGAAQVLGKIGDAELLQAEGPQVRPLVKAAGQGDRRLRFAAAEAIMNLKPTKGFAGSSDLVSTLAFFAGSPGAKRALVAFPNAAVAGQLGAMLTTEGYDVDLAMHGRDAYLQAIGSGDYELIVLSNRLDRVPVWVVYQQLRRDVRTSRVPIALVAEEGPGEIDRMHSLCATDPLSSAFIRPLTPEGIKFHVDRLQERAGGGLTPAELRSTQAGAALGWLKELFEASPRDFDVRQHEQAITRALSSPEHSAKAAELLGLIGTHTAQTSLADLANTATQPLAMRQAASAALAASIKRHGIQLTTAEIQHQYDRYNASEIEPVESQELLAQILDAMESKWGMGSGEWGME